MGETRDTFYPLGLSFVAVNAIALALRLWARGSRKAFGYDDAAMAISFVGFLVFVSFLLAAVDNGIGATTMEPGFDPIKAAKYFTISQVVYILATGISKLGVGMVLFRLAENADMARVRITLIVSMAVVGLWSLVTALIFALQCRPLSVAWGVGTGTCISSSVIGGSGIALSAMDVASSWLFALLPVHMLRKAQLPFKVKMSVLILLGLVAVSSVATIVRLKYVVQVSQASGEGGLAAADIIQLTLEATIFSLTEIGLSILAASLTALRPLLRKLPFLSEFGSSGSHPRSKGLSGLSSGQGQDRAKGPSYRLDDLDTTTGDSQENIIDPKIVQKEPRVDINPGPRVARRDDRSEW